MQVKHLQQDGFLHKVQIILPAERLQAVLKDETRKLASNVEIDGFRPGKAPTEIIQQKYGTRLLNLASEELMRQAFLKLAGDEKIKLSEVHSMKSVQLAHGKDFIFETEYEVLPDINLNVSDAIKVERVTAAELTDEDVASEIDGLRQQTLTYEDILLVGTPAGKGHLAVFDCKLQLIGYPQENQELKEMSVDMDKDYPSMAFVEGVRGMVLGDTREIRDSIRLQQDPQNPQNPDGKEVAAVFQVRLKKLQKKVLPELNEEFYKGMGIESGKEEDFRLAVRKNMEYELMQAINRIQRHNVYESIIAAHGELMVPPMRLEREAKRMRERSIAFWMQTTGAKTPPNENEFPLKMFESKAERQLKAGMLLAEFAHHHSISPKSSEVKEYIHALATTQPDPAKAEKEYLQNTQFYRHVHSVLLEELAIKKYMETVQVLEKSLPYKEVMRIGSRLH